MKGHLFGLTLLMLAVFATAEFPSWKESHAIGQHAWSPLRETGGGTHCVACTLVLHFIETYSTAHAVAIDDFVGNHLCNLFNDSKLKSTCDELESTWGPTVIKALADKVDPDDACMKMKLCTDATCNLIQDSSATELTFSENWESYVARTSSPDPATVGASFDWIKDLIKRISEDHVPITDVDGDRYSGSMEQLRGAHWRGKDCDDLDAKIHPGRKVNPQGKPVDFNCNGISGTNPDTGAAYQDELCGANKQMGVAVFGDSAGAHFELPGNWFNASTWDSNTFDGALGVLLDEVDLPYKSTYTGFVESTDDVPVSSVYKKLREADQCNHRDFQNLGVNGGASRHFHNIEAFARDQQDDQPVMMFLELVGNDVCNHKHTFDYMTTPDVFETNILKMLNYLDTVAPAGSHMVMVGLADGRVLYETLHDRLHPAGMLYPVLYDYLNCLNISPCWGWMNGDESVREGTFTRSSALNAVYPKIIAENTFKNFDMQYYEFPIREMIEKWVADGKDPAELIEPVDGFHPGQKANALFADYLWEHLQQDQPTWIPETNPNNAKIIQLFGDQGGY